MLCATLYGRESIVGLFGFRFRRVAPLPVTATYIAKDNAFYSRGPPLRSFCGHTSSKLNFPLHPAPCWRSVIPILVIPIPSDSSKDSLSSRRRSLTATRRTNMNTLRVVRLISVLFPPCLFLIHFVSASLFSPFLYALFSIRYKKQLPYGAVMSVVGVFSGIVWE